MVEKYLKYGTPLIKLVEEASEVIQILCKIERFGLDNHHPVLTPDKTNRLLLEQELNDLEFAINEVRKWVKEVPEGADIKTIE